jgi:thioredoxin-like negative regulator of GroEL
MAEHTGEFPLDDLRNDPETRLEFLIEADVIDVDEHDRVTATVAFEDSRSVYADTYQDVDDETIAETVADLFDVPIEEARARLAEDLTREDLITYLSLQSHIDRDLPQDVLVLLTSMVAGVGFDAVPDSMPELDDDTYEDFVAEHGEAVIIVWSYPCDPCRSLREELPAFRDNLPDGVALAGVDGDAVGKLRTEFDVTSAPTFLFFSGSELADTFQGYLPVDVLAQRIEEVYG